MVTAIRAAQTVEVPIEYDIPEAFVRFHAAVHQRHVLFRQVAGLEFQPQASLTGHVEAELEGRDVPALVVGNGGYMGGHDAGGIDEGSSVLHEHPLQAVGIVRSPDFVEVLELPVVHASTAGGAALHQHVGILLPHAFHYLIEALNVFHVETVLLRAQIRAAHGEDRPVTVPFHIVDGRGELKGVVKDAEHEVLHVRVGKVQHPLVAFLIEFPPGTLHHPVGVCVRQLGLGVHHFRLNPNTELKPFGMSVLRQVVHALGQLLHIHLPVAQTSVVIVARIGIAEPAVVQDEHLQAHARGVVHHAEERLRVEGEIGAFPAVEEDGVDVSAAVHAPFAGPAVEVARGLPGAVSGEGPEHVGRAETGAGRQRIGRGMRADSRYHAQAVLHVALEAEAEVAAPGQRAGHHLAVVLPEFGGPEAQEEGRVAALGHLRTPAALDDLGVVPQEFIFQLHLMRPNPVHVGQKVLVRREPQRAGSVLEHVHGRFSAIDDLRMGGNHILRRIRVEHQVHQYAGHIVLHVKRGGYNTLCLRRFMFDVTELGVMRAVGIFQVQGRLSQEAAAGGGVGEGAAAVPAPFGRNSREFFRVDAGPVIELVHLAVFPDGKDEGSPFRLNGDDAGLHRRDGYRLMGESLFGFPGTGRKEGQKGQEAEEDSFHKRYNLLLAFYKCNDFYKKSPLFIEK